MKQLGKTLSLVSVFSSPLTAVIRSTSRLWVLMVSPHRWSCPPAPRNPEAPARLSQLLAGHNLAWRSPHLLLEGRRRTGPALTLKLSTQTRNHVVFGQHGLTGKTGRSDGLWELFTSGESSSIPDRKRLVPWFGECWRCWSLPLIHWKIF